MTKEEVAKFNNQWTLANQARIDEARRMSPAKRVRDLDMLFEFGETLGWSVPTGGEGWEYWRRLKELTNV